MGSSPLWVAKQHGHSVATMFRAYVAWTEGPRESDIKLIRKAMRSAPQAPAALTEAPREFGTTFVTGPRPEAQKYLRNKEMVGGKGGTRTLDPGIMSAVL